MDAKVTGRGVEIYTDRKRKKKKKETEPRRGKIMKESDMCVTPVRKGQSAADRDTTIIQHPPQFGMNAQSTH